MANFKVFSEIPSQLLAQVSQPAAASLLAQVSQPTAACLLAQVSQPAAASLLAQVSQPTAACLLAVVSQPTAACLNVTMSNLTAASLVMTLGDRATADVSETVTATTTAFVSATTRNVISYSSVTFTALNAGPDSASVKLQLSPDGANFKDDPSLTAQTIAAGDMFFFVPGRFVKYARLQYATAAAATTASLTLFFQAHV